MVNLSDRGKLEFESVSLFLKAVVASFTRAGNLEANTRPKTDIGIDSRLWVRYQAYLLTNQLQPKYDAGEIDLRE